MADSDTEAAIAASLASLSVVGGRVHQQTSHVPSTVEGVWTATLALVPPEMAEEAQQVLLAQGDKVLLPRSALDDGPTSIGEALYTAPREHAAFPTLSASASPSAAARGFVASPAGMLPTMRSWCRGGCSTR